MHWSAKLCIPLPTPFWWIVVLSTLTNWGGIAANFPVSNLNDSGAGSLRKAVVDSNAAGGSNTITFNGGLVGTIILTSGQLSISNHLNIVGPGAGLLAVSGNNTSRVFKIAFQRSAVISGLTICNGRVEGTNSSTGNAEEARGGGIWNNNGSLVVNDCMISNNVALGGTITGGFGLAGHAFGGGISGSVRITNSLVVSNMALGGFATNSPGDARGGGISGADMAYNCRFIGNTARGGNAPGSGSGGNGQGGGIELGSDFQLLSCIVSNNTAQGGDGENVFDGEGDGGGVFMNGSGEINDCTIAFNSASGGNGIITHGDDGGIGQGGGVYITTVISSSEVTIRNSTINNNTAIGGLGSASGGFGGPAYGGGVAKRSNNYVDLTMTNCTITGNIVTGGIGANSGIVGDDGFARGGGLYNSDFDGIVTMVSCTVTHNSLVGPTGSGAPSSTGGGINRASGTVTFINTIIAQNTASTTNADISGGFSSLSSYNLIGHRGNSQGITNGINANQVGSGGGVVNPTLGPLQDNGGPTKTRALLAGSPAIDKGNSSGTTTDQRGNTRPTDDAAIANASGGDGSDIGAFEVTVAAGPTLSITRATNQATISWFPNTPGYVLQERLNLSSGSWSNSISGITNPVSVTIALTNKFYRLIKP
jgi:hypothetical protein